MTNDRLQQIKERYNESRRSYGAGPLAQVNNRFLDDYGYLITRLEAAERVIEHTEPIQAECCVEIIEAWEASK